jgi:hypothetical protein
MRIIELSLNEFLVPFVITHSFFAKSDLQYESSSIVTFTIAA